MICLFDNDIRLVKICCGCGGLECSRSGFQILKDVLRGVKKIRGDEEVLVATLFPFVVEQIPATGRAEVLLVSGFLLRIEWIPPRNFWKPFFPSRSSGAKKKAAVDSHFTELVAMISSD